MNKNYVVVISILLLLVLLVGGYAFYKANNQSMPAKSTQQVAQKPTPTPVDNATPTPSTKPVTTAVIPLTITGIKDGDKVSLAKIVVSGTTSPKADVNINGTDVVANVSGKFNTTLTLDEGENVIYVTASDEDGNVAEWTATVVFEPAP